MSKYVIETSGLTKKFPHKTAVDHVDMHVEAGDIYGFIGKNGAGKTTTMKLILGLLNTTEGQVKLFGSDDLTAGRKRIGSLIEAPGIYSGCTAFENMKRFAILSGGTDEEVRELLELVGLGDTGKRKAGKFSLGMKQRLGIAIALLGHPDVLVLDEPINGLDPEGIKEIRDTIIRLNQKKHVTFLISSHLLDELAKITTRYGIINNGVLVEEIAASELDERCRQHLKITVSDVEKSVEIIKEHFHIDHIETEGNNVVLYSDVNGASAINTKLIENGVTVLELTANDGAFENYFIEKIG